MHQVAEMLRIFHPEPEVAAHLMFRLMNNQVQVQLAQKNQWFLNRNALDFPRLPVAVIRQVITVKLCHLETGKRRILMTGQNRVKGND